MIRFAQTQDISGIIQTLRAFSEEATVGFRHFTQADHDRLVPLVQNWIQNHYVKVALSDDAVVGCIIAEKINDFWDPSQLYLQERAWYILNDHRATRLSVSLWQHWNKDSQDYLMRGIVNGVLMSTQGEDSNFNPGKRGWQHIETVWIKKED